MQSLSQQHLLCIFAGFVALYYGAEFLVKGATQISLRFGISPLVVGLTVVAFGTSAPELLVCLQANFHNSPDQAFGTIIGSNICNIALILGIGAVIKPIQIHTQVIRREAPILLLSSIVFVAMLWDQKVMQWEGWVLFAGILLYVITSLRTVQKSNPSEDLLEISKDEIEEAQHAGTKELAISILWIIIGLIGLKYGANWLVHHGSILAKQIGISEAIIGLILLAFGTSLPELATSIVAARKGHGDIITGNAVGSCIFNILAVIGITAMVKSMPATNINWFDLGVMLGVTLLITPLMWRGMKLSKRDGILLLIIYFSYITSRYLMDTGVI